MNSCLQTETTKSITALNDKNSSIQNPHMIL